MTKLILAVAVGALTGLASPANAHDGCYEDHVSQVDHYRGEDVIHYDHHHYGYDEDGNEIVIHHDHHYAVQNDDYGYRRHHSHRRFTRFFLWKASWYRVQLDPWYRVQFLVVSRAEVPN